MDENEIRQTLGIDDKADIGGAIRNMQARIDELEATLASDSAKADKAAVAKLRADLAEAQRRILSADGETKQRIAAIEEDRRVEKARHRVENLVNRGKIEPRNQEIAFDLALSMPEEKFDAWVATLQGVDLRERGVASANDLADFEPTQSEIAIARSLGNWNDAKPDESRLALMRIKAKERGMTLPAGVQ